MYQKIELLSRNHNNFINLTVAKQYLRVDHSEDDELIQEMIDTVLNIAEDYLGKTLVIATWKTTIFNNFSETINILRSPLNNIIQFKIYKSNNEIIYLNDDCYFVDYQFEKIKILQPLSAAKIEITYQTGYETLPLPLKQGMLEHLAKIYDLRGVDQAIPLSARSLYQPYKRVRL